MLHRWLTEETSTRISCFHGIPATNYTQKRQWRGRILSSRVLVTNYESREQSGPHILTAIRVCAILHVSEAHTWKPVQRHRPRDGVIGAWKNRAGTGSVEAIHRRCPRRCHGLTQTIYAPWMIYERSCRLTVHCRTYSTLRAIASPSFATKPGSFANGELLILGEI